MVHGCTYSVLNTSTHQARITKGSVMAIIVRFSHSGIRGTLRLDTSIVEWDGRTFPLAEARSGLRACINAAVARDDAKKSP